MAPKAVNTATTGSDGGTKLTAREQELLGIAWQCMETEPKLDLKKFAELAGMTNVGSAGNSWRAIKNKVGFGTAKKNEDGDGAPANTPKTPTSTGRKRKSATAKDEDGTPTKKGRVTKSKGVKTEEDGDDGDVLAGADTDVKAEKGGVIKEEVYDDEDGAE